VNMGIRGIVLKLVGWLKSNQRGQSVVEFSLTMPFFLVIGLGSADVARATYSYIVITNAAASGALYGSLNSSNASNTSGIQSATLANTQTLGGSSPTTSSQVTTDSGGYQAVSVTVSFSMTTAGWPGVPNPLAIIKTTTMRVMR